MSNIEYRMSIAEEKLSEHTGAIDMLNKLTSDGQKNGILMEATMKAVHKRLDKINISLDNQLDQQGVVDILTATLDANLARRIRTIFWAVMASILTPLALAVFMTFIK